MSPEPELSPTDPRVSIMGMHRIVPYAFNEIDVTQLWESLIKRVEADPGDAAALVDLSTILQSLGDSAQASQVLHAALQIRRTFCVVHGDGSGPRLLALVTPGDFMANTPLDFLMEGSNAVLWLHYVNGDTTVLENLPEHDVAFMAIGESNENGPVLARMELLLSDWRGPIMNNDPLLINSLTRDGVNAIVAGEPSLFSPETRRFPRIQLEAVAMSFYNIAELAPGLDFPLIVRPIGTHAGHGMVRVADTAELAAYLAGQDVTEFYVAPFIDYRGADGLFNKQRIVLIKGKPYPCHMALSDHWMVHYLSAGMATSPEKRAVEARWMADFDTDFAMRHADAFAGLFNRIGLDYFGIDCAEMPDGRLLMFELDVAMIVHNMDSAELYPYKRNAMRKLFDGFLDAVATTRDDHARRSAA